MKGVIIAVSVNCFLRVLLKRGNGKRKTEDYSAETRRGNASLEFLQKLRNCLILVYSAEIFEIGGNHYQSTRKNL